KVSGLLYEYFRNDKLDARNFFATSRPPLRWNVFGAAAGGPVIRNKTFYFAHVEFQRQRIGNVRTLSVPTAAHIGGHFSNPPTPPAALLPFSDPSPSRPTPSTPPQPIRDQFPGNFVPSTRTDPAGARIAALFPLPNRAPANPAGASNWPASNTNALNIPTATA